MASDVLDEIIRLPDQVKNIETGSRISSAYDARRLLSQALQEDQIRSRQRAVVDGCMDGNAPVSQQLLNQQGRAWECNINWLGLESIVDSSRVPYYALFSGVPTYANFKTAYEQDNPDAEIWNKKISEKFTCLLNQWKKFKWNLQAQQYEMIYEGWGPLIFEDPADWRFTAIPARAVLTPKEAESTLSDALPWVLVLKKYRVHELYDKIRNEKAAEARGWSVKNVKDAILRGTKGYGGDQNMSWKDRPWEEWQLKYRNKELYASFTDCDIIRCAHLFIKEYSGKISHYIFNEAQLPASSISPPEKDQGEVGFLFEDRNRFEGYNQCMNVAFQNTGRGTWHSVRGTGLKSYRHEEIRNRLDNKAVNNAILASCVFLQGVDAKSNQKLQLMVAGSVAQVPAGATAIQHRFAGDIEGTMAVSRYLRNDLSQKIGAFQSRTLAREDGRGEMPTAEQVKQAATKEGSLTTSQIDNYYLELDCLYSEVFRRVMKSSDKEAKKFRDDCVKSGVPLKALEEMEYVQANRLSGYGSPNMQKMAIQEMAPFVSMLNERGKNNFINLVISTSMGPDKVPVLNPPMEEPDIDEAMAVLENSSLHDGEIPLVISGMDNVAHLNIHLQDAEERLGPLREQVEAGEEIDPAALQDAYQYVSALGAHCEDHLNRIASDPSRKSQYQLFKGQLNLLTSFHGKLRSAIRAAQAQQAQQNREEQQAQMLSALDQQKLMSSQQDMQIKQAKAQNDIQIKRQKAASQDSLKRWQVGRNAQLDTVKTAEEVRLNRIKTASELQNNKLKARSNGTPTNGSKGK